MRALLFTTGSPYARAIRIILDELEIDYERREEVTTPSAEERASTTPTLQVPVFWDGELTLWESSTIAEYLISEFDHRLAAAPPLSKNAYRPEARWHDKLVFSTIQTFGNAATTVSQLTWAGVGVKENAHLARSSEKLSHILEWLNNQLTNNESGFLPDCVSLQDIFLLAHVRFVQARPLGLDLHIDRYQKLELLLSRLDQRASVRANPVHWWEPGVVGYEKDGTPKYDK